MCAFLILLYIACRVWRVTDSCLWFDEIFSLHAARHDWGGMLNFIAQDLIHPPLFYALLKIWVAIGGESLPWLRLFPALTSVAAMIPFFLLARQLKLSATEINLSLLLLALNGSLIKYAQELRMYSLLLFFTLSSLWLFVRVYGLDINQRRDATPAVSLGALFVVNLLLIYTHYFGWLVVASEFVFLLGWRRRRLLSFAVISGLLAGCFGVWLYVVAQAAASMQGLGQNIGWMSRPTLVMLLQFYATLNEIIYYPQSNQDPLFWRAGALLGMLLFGFPVLLWIMRQSWPWRRADVSSWLMIFSVLPVGMAFVASYLLPYSIWGTRHLIIVIVPYLMLIAVALNRLRLAWLKRLVLTVLAGWTIFIVGALAVRPPEVYVWCTWETLAREMVKTESAQAGPVKVYAFEDLIAYHLWFTLSSMKEHKFNLEARKGLPGLVEDPAYFLPRGFHEVTMREAKDPAGAIFHEDYFWIAFRDHQQPPPLLPLKLLTAQGYVVDKTLEMKARGEKAFLVAVKRP